MSTLIRERGSVDVAGLCIGWVRASCIAVPVAVLALSSCTAGDRDGRGEPVDDAEVAEPRSWPPAEGTQTTYGPAVVAQWSPEDRGEELERAMLAQIPTTESLLAELRAAVAATEGGVTVLRAGKVSSPEVIVGAELAVSSVSISEVLAGEAIPAASIRLVQPAPEGELSLDASFFPSPDRTYLLVVYPSSSEPGSYELIQTRSIPGYAYSAPDGTYRFDIQPAPVVSAEKLATVVYQ